MKKKIKTIGAMYQRRKIRAPKRKTNNSTKIPTKIKILLIKKPINLENKFPIKVSKIFPTSKPLGYSQAMRCQGEKKVFKRFGIEKK